VNLKERIWFDRRGMTVRRFHQHYLTDPENVGKHSMGVALLVDKLHPTAAKEVIMAALTHDLGECVLGDIPAPTKRQLPPLALEALNHIEDRALEQAGHMWHNLITADDLLLIKLADTLDGLLLCTEEMIRGNRSILPAGVNYQAYLVEHLNKCVHTSWYPQAIVVSAILQRDWSEFQ
jgi:5'-deoxynucleotidase YfbR-like HD superfamily hydrolase